MSPQMLENENRRNTEEKTSKQNSRKQAATSALYRRDLTYAPVKIIKQVGLPGQCFPR